MAEEPSDLGTGFHLFARKSKQDSCLDTTETIYKPIASVDQTDIEFVIPGDSETNQRKFEIIYQGKAG